MLYAPDSLSRFARRPLGRVFGLTVAPFFAQTHHAGIGLERTAQVSRARTDALREQRERKRVPDFELVTSDRIVVRRSAWAATLSRMPSPSHFPFGDGIEIGISALCDADGSCRRWRDFSLQTCVQLQNGIQVLNLQCATVMTFPMQPLIQPVSGS